MTISVSSSNGEAPADALEALPGVNGDGTAHTAPHVTAASYRRIRAAMQAAGMGDLLPTADGWSCYRDLDAQRHMIDIGLTTIPVGQSIHGEWSVGSAVDFQGLGGFGAPRHEWLRHHGPEYGWYQPAWAAAGGSLPEPWHWEYDHRNDAHAGEDDDMTPEESAQLAQAAGNAAEARRILAFMVTGNGAATDAEANYVNQSKQLKRDTEEIRRMDGVMLGWQPPAPGSPEVSSLAKLWGQTASTLARGASLLVFAIVVLLALVAGVAVGLLAETREGVVAGVAVVAGGLLATVLANLPRDTGS